MNFDFYNARITFCDEQIRQYSRRINFYSFMRLACIAAGVVFIYQALAVKSILLTFLACFATIIVFVWLVKQHSSLYARGAWFERLRTVNRNEISSMESGANVYSDGGQWSNEKHSYSSDLDVYGDKSLYQLLNRAATAGGNRRLSEWLGAAADLETVHHRQEAIRELSTKSDLTQDIQAELLVHLNRDQELQRFFAYLHLQPLFGKQKVLQLYIAAAPYLFITSVALSFFFNPVQLMLVLLGIVNGGLIFLNMGRINKTDRLVNRAGTALGSYAGVFSRIEKEQWQSHLCRQMRAEIMTGGLPLSRRIGELSTLINKLDYRLNVFVGLLLNYIFVWDLRQVFAIEAWKDNNRHDLEVAFDVIGRFEALISLTSLHSNNPDWCFPSVTDPGQYTIVARQLAHPLIRPGYRVANDFTLVNARRIEIITGSNMAGKSTFLRTIGINAVLAFAGAPVCAQSLEISLMKLASYMRIKDSLNESTSTFKAELDRLQMILQMAEGNEKVYLLIDEMLRGTNSVDKYRGSKAVIKKLIAAKVSGMVATHDLQLAGLENEYPREVRNFHFDIRVDGSEMRFDYKLKEGECSTFNASLLLQRIGVQV